MRIRNSVKAVVIKNNRVLFNKMLSPKSGEVFYILPGGGQEAGESFVDALHRECLEELGARINIKDLVLVREYIGKHHEFSVTDSEVHQVEYMFECDILTDLEEVCKAEMDKNQVGYEWIPIDEIAMWNIYPKILKTKLTLSDVIYLGDVN